MERSPVRVNSAILSALDHHHPGLPLARAVAGVAAQGAFDVLVLGNHGLVVGAESCAAAQALVAEVEERLALPPRDSTSGDDDTLTQLCAGTDYRQPHDPLCHGLSADPHSLAIATTGSLYPDHVVFLGPAQPTLEAHEDLTAKTRRAESDGVPPPVALLVPWQRRRDPQRCQPGCRGHAQLPCACRQSVAARCSYSVPLTGA